MDDAATLPSDWRAPVATMPAPLTTLAQVPPLKTVARPVCTVTLSTRKRRAGQVPDTLATVPRISIEPPPDSAEASEPTATGAAGVERPPEQPAVIPANATSTKGNADVIFMRRDYSPDEPESNAVARAGSYLASDSVLTSLDASILSQRSAPTNKSAAIGTKGAS